MKKRRVVLLFWGLMVFLAFQCEVLNLQAQTVIENPEKPLSKKSGRVVQLKEMLRITDEEGKFFFKELFDIKVDKDGSIFIQESSKLYKFDSSGKYIKNIYRKGEGPGELNQNLNDLVLTENEIILFSSNMNKIVRLDKEEKLIEEIKPKPGTFWSLLGYYNRNYYLLDSERLSFERKSGIREDNLILCVLNSAGETKRTSWAFPMTVSYNFGERFVGMMTICNPQTARENKRYVYLFHTPDYLVKLLDLEKPEVVRSFRRKYERVKYEPPKLNQRFPIVLPKYHNDICRLAIHKGHLWVVTSTFDKNKGILVDVFNQEGAYLDNFYLPLMRIPRNNIQYYAPMDIDGDFLFVIEVDEDEQISVAKYEIIDR